MSTTTARRIPGARRGGTAGRLEDMLKAPANPVRATLDSLNGNCFVANLELELVYMNRKAEETVRELAPAVQQTFGVSLQDLLGGSIHRFHKDPQRIERILHDPTALPRTAVFEFGGITLRTHISAVTDETGTRHGYVVLWDNVSERNARAAKVYGEHQAATSELERVASEITDVARTTSLQAETSHNATEQLRAAVEEIARSSNQATVQVREAVSATNESVAQLRVLQQTSREIGDFLRLITSVADQTKLLALNATIEAARAGEAGRGFAVVADEVKQLAGTTSASIGDIESRIEAIQTAAMDSVQALEMIASLVDQISQSQETVAAAIEEQSATTSEIAGAIAMIADGARATAGQSSTIVNSVERVNHQAETLNDVILST